MTRVVLHIERLVLNGVDHADSAGLARSLQVELQRLMAGTDVVQRLSTQGDTHHLRAGKVRVAQGDGVADTGRAVARRIVRGFTP